MLQSRVAVLLFALAITSLSILVSTVVGAETGSNKNTSNDANASLTVRGGFDPITLIEREKEKTRHNSAMSNLAKVRRANKLWKIEQARIRAERIAREQARKAAAAAKATGVSSGTLESIAQCESGGNPAAISANGSYRGKYQFDYGTWASVGGSGDPAAAPEAEQDMRAAMLYARSGSSPWPVCGR